MWYYFALASALCLGFYDVLRKYSLKENAVLPVLLCSTLTSSIILLPLLILSTMGHISSDSFMYVPLITPRQHLVLVIKASIVLTSWIFVYYGMKHLPLSIVSPIRATAPVWTLIGAMTIFAERPNYIQWIGLIVAFLFFFLFSVAGKREGINFKANKWVWCVVIGTLVGACSALFDKFVVRYENIDKMAILTYYSFYQFLINIPLLFIIWWPNHKKEPFKWKWSIAGIGVIIIVADWFYYIAINDPESLISLISPIRRCNSIVAFTLAYFIFKERNMLRKGLCLLGILAGIAIIVYGS